MPLKVSDGMGSWIKDFKASDAPQFAGKSTKDRRDMAIAAYLSKKNESVNEIAPAVAAIAGRVLAPKIGQAVMKKTGSKMLSRAAQGATQGAADSIAKKDVNEISKDLAAKYIKKRADDLPHAGYMMNDPHSSERRKKGVRDYVKMQKGIKTAVNKLTGKAMVPATKANESIGGGAAAAMAMSDFLKKDDEERSSRDDEERRKKRDSETTKKTSEPAKPKKKIYQYLSTRSSKPFTAKQKRDAEKYHKNVHLPRVAAANAKWKAQRAAAEKERLANRPMHQKAIDAVKSKVGKMFGKKTEAYMSGHGHGSGVVYGGKHDDPAFQALMKKHGVTHRLIGKSGKSAKLIGSPDNIRKVLQSEDKTTDAERAAIDAFMKKKGAKQLPPGKAQGHTGKSFSIKPMGISPDKMGLKGRGKHLDKDLVHKEDKAYGPTGIAYSVPKGHPDAVDPKTGKKKYPPHLTLDKMRAAFAPTKGGKDVKKEQGPTGKPSRITRADVDQAKRDLTVAQIRKKISNLRNEQTSGQGMHPNSVKNRIKPGWSNKGSTSSPAPNPKVSDPALKQRIAKKKKDFLDKNPTRRKTTPDAIRHDRLAAAQAKADTEKAAADAAKAEKQKSPGKISRFASWSKDKVKKYGPAATVAGGLAHAIGSV